MIKSQTPLKPLWTLAFRPFFLAASLIGSLCMILWTAWLYGFTFTTGYESPIIWHANEMIFGFAAAVLVGFLFTAIQNWTGIPGVAGKKLQVLLFLWFAGRALVFLSHDLIWLAFFSELAFLAYSFLLLAPYLNSKKQRRNLIFLAILALLFFGKILFGTGIINDNAVLARAGLILSFNSILLAIIFITGRIIPFFATKAVRDAQILKSPWLEWPALLSTFAFLISDTFWPNSAVGGAIACAAFVFHSLRWLGWNIFQAIKIPILWILYLAYAWVIVGFALKALVVLNNTSPQNATHAFAVGAISIMIYGMMSRVSLGHTGRAIKASKMIIAGYLLLNLSAIIRVFVWQYFGQFYGPVLASAALLWVVSFLIFFTSYLPILTSKRADAAAKKSTLKTI